VNINKYIVALGLILIIDSHAVFAQGAMSKHEIDLSGKWIFQIDSLDKGVNEKWFLEKLNDEIILPGSMLTNGKGNEVTLNTRWTGSIWDSLWYRSPAFEKYRQPNNIKVAFWLQPDKHYTGAAWYQKKIIVPANFKNGFNELILERCHWETSVWIDDNYVGMQNALATSHNYNLSKFLTPGTHTISIRIDNRVKTINPGLDAHSISDNTQTNWNGIIGKIALINRPAAYISNIALYPNAATKTVEVKLEITNTDLNETKGTINLTAFVKKELVKQIGNLNTKNITLKNGINNITLQYALNANAPLWDEYNPNVLSLKTTLIQAGKKDEVIADFGLRDFETKGTRFTVNGTPIFLRGTLECAIFPKTGFPPTDVTAWEKLYSRCKDYGLNHVRFHSWCPPEAAFVAADKMGVYLSVEASTWADDLGKGDAIDQYVYDESERIVKAYGNHPSFILMLYGNEAHGKNAVPYLSKFMQYWKAKNDNRQKYSSSAGFPESPESQFVSTPNPRIQRWAAGLKSPINANAPSTNFEWGKNIAKDKPTVSHEIGQWCVYPDFKEIKKYTGPLKAKNFEIFQDFLADNGMKHLADSFLLASGKLQVLCYKADIEAALRTKGFAGFQLLDLHDFSGQGTAIVGVVNAFWEDKGYVTGPEFKNYCNNIVPLARMKKMVFENNEDFDATIQIANFSKATLKENISWDIKNENGTIIWKGNLPASSIPIGNEFVAGEIKQNLSTITKASRLQLTVTIGKNKNTWDFFVYPSVKKEIKETILVTQQLDSIALSILNSGGKVLLSLKKGTVLSEKGGNVQIGFSSIFWNTSWTNRQAPTTLGILCNPAHAAFNEFPTQYHSNYQWWDAMSHSNAIRLDVVDKNIQPILRVIDDWYTAKPLALLFECTIGKGKLLISGIDLINDAEKRPEARQLMQSIKMYMASAAFNPTINVTANKITGLTNSN
jgi:Glycosyl hydrolases family 2, sugar binding domain/Glycosyl hydrolases family 2